MAPWSLEEGGGGRGRDLNSSASSRSQALRAEQVACQAGRKHYGPSRLLAKQVASTTGQAGCMPSRSQALRAKQVACQAGRKHYGPSRLLAKQVASTTGRKHYGPSRLQEWRAGEGGRGGNAHPFMPYDDV